MRNLSILVADGQRLFAEALGAALRQRPGLSVVDDFPDSGLTAIDAAEFFRPDVALLDFWLPEMEGPAATRRILTQVPECKVLLLSGFHGPVQIEAALESGAVGFLTKAVTLDQIGDAVERAAAGESPVFEKQLEALVAKVSQKQGSVAKISALIGELTRRELEVLRVLAYGASVDTAARQLSISPRTVEVHIKHILKKTGARSHAEAVAMALYSGEIRI